MYTSNMQSLPLPDEPTYIFPALRGIQAGREYYVVMCPLRLIPRIFIFDEEELRSELRAQRTLNRARIPEIARYLISNPDNYIFSALTASIDGHVTFVPAGTDTASYRLGNLIIPMTAHILINDGQHRRAAIEEAIKERPELGDESIAVVFFVDAGLERSQQMFADLNTHAIRPSMSIGILYDHRDPLAELAREVGSRVPVFKDRIELEKTTISNRSTKLFTLSALYQATREFLTGAGQLHANSAVDAEQRDLTMAFWSRLGDVIPEWRQLEQGHISSATLRAEYIHAHGVALHALGRAGGALVATAPQIWFSRLEALDRVDWRRTNSDLWEGRALVEGRVSKAHRHVLLTTNAIKQVLNVPLSDDEQQVEAELQYRYPANVHTLRASNEKGDR